MGEGEVGVKVGEGAETRLGKRAACIIMTVDSLEEAQRLVEGNPVTIEGLKDELTILEWDPMFGAVSDDAGPPWRPCGGLGRAHSSRFVLAFRARL